MADEFSTGPDIRNAFRETPDFKPNGHYHNGHDKTPWKEKEPPWIYPEDPWEAFPMSSREGIEIPHRSWAVDQWLPDLETTGFSGDGGEGKTLLTMQLATAKVLGLHFLGIPLAAGKVFALLCEDRPRDADIRQKNINAHYQCQLSELENLTVYPRRSHPRNRLMIFDRDGIGHETVFFLQLLRELEKLCPSLTILDTRADLFLGNQNDEDQARTFVHSVPDKIAEVTGGATMMLYHPSLSGMRDGSGRSGNVQWSAAYRSGWYLISKKADKTDTEPFDPYARTLTRVKSNFSLRDETIELKWDCGVFIRTDTPVEPAYKIAADLSKGCRVFTKLLEQYTQQGRIVSASVGSPNFAPKVFAADPDREGCSQQDLDRAMSVLFKRNEIKSEKPKGERSARLVVVRSN